jgi:hypothetical protein
MECTPQQETFDGGRAVLSLTGFLLLSADPLTMAHNSIIIKEVKDRRD